MLYKYNYCFCNIFFDRQMPSAKRWKMYQQNKLVYKGNYFTIVRVVEPNYCLDGLSPYAEYYAG